MIHFSIITPSFHQSGYIRRAIASVADQTGPDRFIRHHVQDGGSTDGTVDWLRQNAAEVRGQSSKGGGQFSKQEDSMINYTFSYESEGDDGMYEAINRGVDFALRNQVNDCLLLNDMDTFVEAEGKSLNIHEQSTIITCDSIIAWLNCDEQYLPDAFKIVGDYFAAHPDVDFVYGNTLLLNEQGELLTFRKNPPLRKAYIQSDHLYTQSCAMFFRERIFRKGFLFDTRWKAVSDCDFVVRLLNAGFKSGQIDNYLSVFHMTGGNLSGTDAGMNELKVWRKTMPLRVRVLYYPLRIFRYMEKRMLGGFREQFPLEYAIYTSSNPTRRQTMLAESGTARFVSWTR